jgi:hypothetical protein
MNILGDSTSNAGFNHADNAVNDTTKVKGAKHT